MKKKTVSEPESKTKSSPKSKATAKKTSSGNTGSNGNSGGGKKDFLVVGLGASAGGVRALQEFFGTMPPNSGMAFVVVLHLSPEHESNLTEIIQSQTTMPVTVVDAIHRIEPNNVYVISPNRQLEVADGVVRATEPSPGRGSRIAIDVFFRTLAAAYQQNAVCIVMSGTGTDGTLGLKAVKEANGFAVVQDPNDAEYDAMPRSAIATQMADWILPVYQMPERLIRYRNSSQRLHLTKKNGGSDKKTASEIQADESLREILNVLRVRTGHDFSNYKTPTLVRRIARHLQIHDLDDIPAYLDFLRENPDEIYSLLKNLLINVTNFFRDRDAWTILQLEVVPDLFAGKKASETIRVWSCACASGEEAYSLAIILSEYAERLKDPPKFQIFATDVDGQAIAEARENLYPQTIEADVSPERLRRFFVKEGKQYRLKKELREMILFAPHNVLRDPPFSKLDLVTCRNLLIYLNRETQERVMEIFHFALASRGYLFLGGSETAENVPKLFAPLDKKHRIYTRRPPHLAQQTAPRMPVAGRWELKLPGLRTRPHNRAVALNEIHYKLIERLAPPSILVNQDFDIQYLSESAGRFLRFRGGEPSNNLLKIINPDLLPDLRAALFSAQRDNKPADFPNVRVKIEGAETLVGITVRAVGVENDATDYLLVTFEENRSPSAPLSDQEKHDKALAQGKDEAMEAVVQTLQQELTRTKETLRATVEQHEVSIEELKASNEELQAINEELRSTTEELETSKEELQAINEELTTVTHELKEKIDETSRTNSDLQNLMSSTDIATIFLDRELRIKRLTMPVEQLFNITPLDIGRPLEHFTHSLEYKNMAKDAAEVLGSLKMIEREIRDRAGRTFLTRFVPYRTIDDRIEGIVLNFLDITAYKRTEIELNKTRQILDNALEAAEMGVWDFDLTTGRATTNLRHNQIFGLASPVEEWSLEHFRALIRPEDAASLDREFEKALRTGVFDLQARVRLKNGGVRWVYERGRVIYDEAEKPVRMAGVTLDITARKNVEEGIRESEERLHRVVNQASVGIAETDLDGKFTFVNERYCEIVGRAREELLGGLRMQDITHPEDLAQNARFFENSQTPPAAAPFNVENRYVRRDGSIVWASSSVSFGRDRDGAPCFALVVAHDITDRRRAEEALKKSEEQLNLVLESTKDYAIITYDLEGRVTRWNSGAEKIFGYAEREMVGKMTHALFVPEDRAAGIPEKELVTALETGRAEDERWHLRKDGTRFYASGVMQLLRDGVIEGFVKICRDQTERLKAETALRDKNMLAQLVTTQEDERRRIARDIHDHLGQQLTTLRLKLEAVKKMCGDQAVCDQIEQLQNQAEQLDRDVDFLAWELRPAALDDLGLRVTLGNFVAEWSRYSGIKTDFHVTGLTRTRLAFEIETNLYRIAQEALNNIVKHSRAQTVSVLLEKRGETVSLIIEDDGVGFNPSDKKNRSKGLGLTGMSERAKISGGALEIESKKGRGTTIFVRVPVKKAVAGGGSNSRGRTKSAGD